jgi:hypothetical protein
MNIEKQQYLNAIRSESAYPTYRGIINLVVYVYYALAGIAVLGALSNAFSAPGFFVGVFMLIAGLVVAAMIVVLARFFREAALILADIGDTAVDVGARRT